MKTILNITAIFLMLLFGWYFLFTAIADEANTVRKIDYRIYQARQEMMEVEDGQR